MAKSIRVCMDNLRRWGANPRVYVIGALTLLMLKVMMTDQVRAFCADVQVPCSPWLYPFLTDDWYILMMIQFGAVLLFCDAPFMNEGTPYLFIRAGRRGWFWGQALYIAAASLLYQLFIAVSSALLLIPYLEWNADWGKILGTLAQTDAGSQYFVGVSYLTQALYTPARAMLVCLGLSWMVTAIFGMTIFTANLFFSRAWGPVLGSVLAMLPPTALNSQALRLCYFSPGSWMSLSLIRHANNTYLPSFGYILSVGACLLTALTAFSYLRYRKIQIETLPTF